MSITPVSSIPSTVPSLNPILPIPPVKAEENPAEKVKTTPSAGVGEKVDLQA